MECADDNGLWSDCIPTDILISISSRLIAGDYFVFRAVCKSWRSIPSPIHDSHALSHSNNTPCMMTLYQEIGIVEFFHPLYNAITHKTDIVPKLRGARIRSAKGNWSLMSQGKRGMLFFNHKSNDIIELPDLLEGKQNSFHAWTFSCPPDSSSSDCFVVGFENFGSPPPVYIIKVGDSRWTYHAFVNEDGDGNKLGIIDLSGCNNPVFLKNDIVYVLEEKGNLGILSIKENSAEETPTWEFYGKSLPRRKLRSVRKVYTAKDVDNGGILAVFLTHNEGKVEVWRYKYDINKRILEREQITSLDNKTLFVSFGASYLKPCVAQGLENTIYFPMFHDKNGVFYCLASRKHYSFDYSAVKGAFSSPNCHKLDQPRYCIWIEPDVSQLPSLDF
ncbi:F-box/kelch-repeat protein At3g18720-like [Nicotiana tabacum]|uniref:F-box/kelch-repeat protein At3g18720-like n=1 Tax=Nicotiana tabacum TaxID=4097 RepID=A0AC58S6J0_TOBAC